MLIMKIHLFWYIASLLYWLRRGVLYNRPGGIPCAGGDEGRGERSASSSSNLCRCITGAYIRAMIDG
jgi:hypothetical protein